MGWRTGTCDECARTRKIVARRLCATCYRRNQRAGTLPPRVRATFDELLAAAMASGPDACWIWPGGRESNGYAYYSNKVVHRITWQMANGPIPDGTEMDHTCHDRSCAEIPCPHRPCVNPDHLEPVTHQENVDRGHHAKQTHCKRRHLFDLEDHRGVGRCSKCRKLYHDRERARRNGWMEPAL